MPVALLIIPDFHEYQDRIAFELSSRGFQVILAHTCMGKGASVLSRLFPPVAEVLKRRHEATIIKKVVKTKLALVFCIRGEPLTPDFFQSLRAEHPESRYVLYQWDSLSRVNYRPLVPYFDRVLSFERQDCIANGWDYLPLFYVNDFKSLEPNGRDLDVVMIGGYHPSRDRIFHEIQLQAKAQGLTVFQFVYIPVALFLYLMLFKRQRFYCKVHFLPLGLNDCSKLFKRARAVVDVEHIGQTGLTMRTFEALAAGCKLLTTNSAVRLESFFNDNNIAIISRDLPKVDPDFITEPPVPLPFAAFSLPEWLTAALVDSRSSGVGAC